MKKAAWFMILLAVCLCAGACTQQTQSQVESSSAAESDTVLESSSSEVTEPSSSGVSAASSEETEAPLCDYMEPMLTQEEQDFYSNTYMVPFHRAKMHTFNYDKEGNFPVHSDTAGALERFYQYNCVEEAFERYGNNAEMIAPDGNYVWVPQEDLESYCSKYFCLTTSDTAVLRQSFRYDSERQMYQVYLNIDEREKEAPLLMQAVEEDAYLILHYHHKDDPDYLYHSTVKIRIEENGFQYISSHLDVTPYPEE